MSRLSPLLVEALDGRAVADPAIPGQLWAQVPAELRQEMFCSATVPGHPGFSWRRGWRRLDLRPLPEPVRRELVWCMHRSLQEGGSIHHTYSRLVRWLALIVQRGERTAVVPGSIMSLPLTEWHREMAKCVLRGERGRADLRTAGNLLRQCYRFLWIAYDQREWWEQEVWERRFDPRIPLAEHEPAGNKALGFLRIGQPWLRRGAQWHAKVGLETGMMRWATVRSRVFALTHLDRFLSERGIDTPALRDGPGELRALALEFIGDLRAHVAGTGPRAGQRLTGNSIARIMSDVECFYAFMADHRHEAAHALDDPRWLALGDAHARLWRMGEKPRPHRRAAPREDHYIDNTAMGQIMARIGTLGDPAQDGGLGDEQAMRLLMLLALTGRRVSELAMLDFDCLLPLHTTTDGAAEGAVAKLRYQQTKIAGAPDTIVVDDEVVAIVRAQQAWARGLLRSWGVDLVADPPRYLFLSLWRNRRGQRPYSVGTLYDRLEELSRRVEVRDGQSRRVTLTRTHRFRHTKATSLLNAGVPLHVVQRYLGHLSPEMTMHYAQTLQETHEREFLRFKKVTADGRDLQLDPRDLYHMLELDKRSDRVLPNGLCLLPPRQACDRGNACLTCDKFATDATYLPEHTQQLSRLDELIERRREAFRAKTGREMSEDNVWLAQRRQEQRALRKILAALEQPALDAANGQAIRGAGVAARTEVEPRD